MTKKNEPKFRKVTINIPTKIYNDLMARCNELGTNTTTEIVSLIRDGLKQEKVVDYLPSILEQLALERNATKKQKK